MPARPPRSFFVSFLGDKGPLKCQKRQQQIQHSHKELAPDTILIGQFHSMEKAATRRWNENTREVLVRDTFSEDKSRRAFRVVF